jgi:hypothetical protein
MMVRYVTFDGASATGDVSGSDVVDVSSEGGRLMLEMVNFICTTAGSSCTVYGVTPADVAEQLVVLKPSAASEDAWRDLYAVEKYDRLRITTSGVGAGTFVFGAFYKRSR